MATQAVGLHAAAMECLRRAMLPESAGRGGDEAAAASGQLDPHVPGRSGGVGQEAGPGDAGVRVERVQVAAGGQAIVGTVQTGTTHVGQHRKGGGHDEGSRGEPHAPPAGRTGAGTTPAELAHDAGPLAQSCPRCGARTRAGLACRSPAMANGRCRMHGGTSTGPRTAEGLARIRKARTVHGLYGAEMAELRRHCTALRAEARRLGEKF